MAFPSSAPQLHTNTPQIEDVVIVGCGIAGAATALALHRLGIKCKVLEQALSLRAAGGALVVWTNGWHALEALGVAESLRQRFLQLSRWEFYTPDQKSLSSWDVSSGKRGVELRGVDRTVLLETLVNSLPSGTVCYGSRVTKLDNMDGDYTRVELTDGSFIQTKVLIGCDGIGSVVVKELGFGEAHYAGHCAIRGVAVYSEGHDFKTTLRQILGQGVRMGAFPMDSKRVHWFITFNSPPAGRRTSDPKAIKEEALQLVEGWPEMLIDAINRSALETFSKAAISDRWMWPWMDSKLYRNGMTVAGDAMHPITPHLAQGGCTALEDGVLLARELSRAFNANDSTGQNLSRNEEMKRLELALDGYTKERRQRMFPLAVQSSILGRIIHAEGKLFCSVRDAILHRVLTSDSFINPYHYDCGQLTA